MHCSLEVSILRENYKNTLIYTETWSKGSHKYFFSGFSDKLPYLLICELMEFLFLMYLCACFNQSVVNSQLLEDYTEKPKGQSRS